MPRRVSAGTRDVALACRSQAMSVWVPNPDEAAAPYHDVKIMVV